jgi:hypothetical protein
MSSLLYDDIREVTFDAEPNDSGIIMVSKGFSVPTEGAGEFFQRSKEHAGAEIGVELARNGVFKVQEISTPPRDGYSMGPEFEDYYKLHGRLMPRPRKIEERVRELSERNSRLRSRVNELEEKLAQVKNAFPDEI